MRNHDELDYGLVQNSLKNAFILYYTNHTLYILCTTNTLTIVCFEQYI